MRRSLFFAAIALTALAGCTDDSYVGDQSLLTNGNESGAITFGTGLKAVTRAGDITDGDAANLLNKNFVFVGTKGSGATPNKVFDNYQANYVANTAKTTVTNTNNWEYVSYNNLPDGVLTNAGVTAFSITTTGEKNNSKGVDQSIKYWDYGADQYDFAAYSLGVGTGSTPTYATSTAINTNIKSFTLTGSADELKACYISDLVTKYNQNSVSEYGDPVQFKFRSLAAKIRLAFYETVPGYSVKDVQFYTDASSALATDGTQNDPTLFVTTTTTFKGLPAGNGTMTITYPTRGWSNRNDKDYNKAHVVFEATTDANFSPKLVLEDLANLAAAEYKEAAGNSYIGRTSSTATFAGGLVSGSGKYYTILPYETGANLTLRIKYTLVSRDASGEEITVDNASAVIPAELAKWSPNYAYTYIFKIGDMTNGTTGTDANTGNVVYGLTPITLDAVVVDDEEGSQETITTVSEPSITTYSGGKVITANDEYKKDKTIYIIVNNGTSNEALTVGTNALFYTATLTKSTDEGDTPAATAAQSITEESVANALDNGTKDNDSNPTTWTVKDANKWKLVVTKSNLLNASTQIEAEDSPTGNAITVTGAKFEPTTDGYYVFEYLKEAVNYTEEEAIAHNAALTGAKAAGATLSSDEANTYNAKLSGAVKTGDPVPADYATKVGSAATGATLTAEEAVAYNAKLTGALSTTELTAEEAAAYNAKLPGAVSTSSVKTPSSNHFKVIKVVD